MSSVISQEAVARHPDLSRRVSPLPLGVSIGLLTALCVVDIFFTVKLCGGHYVYALDDAYIGAAMAKNLALYGVWGATSHAFTSSTSTPLWLLLLAGANWLFGGSHWTPQMLSTDRKYPHVASWLWAAIWELRLPRYRLVLDGALGRSKAVLKGRE